MCTVLADTRAILDYSLIKRSRGRHVVVYQGTDCQDHWHFVFPYITLAVFPRERCHRDERILTSRIRTHLQNGCLKRKTKRKNSCLKGSGLRCNLHINIDEFSSRTQASQSWWQGITLQINIDVSDYGANICYLVNTQEYCTVNQDLTRDVLLYTLTCICTRVDRTCELNVPRKSKYMQHKATGMNCQLTCGVTF